MTSRRQLILVSNRGPVGFSRNDAGEVVERRGAGGLVTALRPIVAQHDVTWVASALSDEDRRVAANGTVEQPGQEGSGYRLRLVAHDAAAYDLYYNVVANPGTLVRAARSRRDAGEPARRAARGVGARLCARERGLRRRGRRGARPRARGSRVLPRLPPLCGAGARAGALPRCPPGALRPHSLAFPGGVGAVARADRARRARGPARERRRRVPHGTLAPRVPRLV